MKSREVNPLNAHLPEIFLNMERSLSNIEFNSPSK